MLFSASYILTTTDFVYSFFYITIIYMSYIGFGYLIVTYGLRVKAISTASMFISSTISGMFLISLIILIESSIGYYNYMSMVIIRCIGFCLFLYAVYMERGNIKGVTYRNKSALCVMFIIFIFMSLSTFTNLRIDFDAKQYTLAFPWITSVTHEIVRNDTFWHNGVYLAYDMLFLSVGNLVHLMGNIPLIDKLKQFDSAAAFILPLSMWVLARSLGANKTISFAVFLSPFTLGSIPSWGDLKNDVYSAGIGIFTLVMLITAVKNKDSKILLLSSLIAGWSVSVKLTNVVILTIPFIYVYLTRSFSLKDKAMSIIVGLIPLLPWMIYAYTATGNPITPVMINLPPEVAHWWEIRNSNGLPSGANTALSYFLPILFGDYKISGNSSIGMVCFVSMLITLVLVIKKFITKKINIEDVIAITALIWLLGFYLARYDNRFLSRYIIVALCIFMAYAATEIGKLRSGRFICIPLLSVMILAILFNPSSIVRGKEFAGIANLNNVAEAKKEQARIESEPYVYLNSLRKSGEAVAVNDHVTLFIPPEVHNLNSLHAVNLNLYTKTYNDIFEYSQEHNIRYLVRRDIHSWGYENIDSFVEKCTTLRKEFPAQAIKVFEINKHCSL